METKTANRKLEAITQALKSQADSVAINLKAIGGNIKISKVVLTAISDVFRPLLESIEGTSLEIAYPIKIISIIVEWMHTSAPLQCDIMPVQEIFHIMQFASEYEIHDLTGEITSFFRSKLNASEINFALIKDVLNSYQHDTVGREIYEMAINDAFRVRVQLYKRAIPGQKYLELLSGLSLQVHNDINKHEVAMLA